MPSVVARMKSSTKTGRNCVESGNKPIELVKLSHVTKFLLANERLKMKLSRMAKYDSRLDRLFTAIGDPTRRAILSRLARGQASVSELAGPHHMALPTVLAHLQKLEDAGLVTSTKQGRVRVCTLVEEAMAPARGWLDEQRTLWTTRLDQMDDYAMQLAKERNQMELDPETDLTFTRTIPVPRSLVWECWTTPKHIKHFFVPKPHEVTDCEIDLRVGGKFNSTFKVDGNEMKNTGVFLEVVDGRKLVFTDTYSEGWKPSADPFMTAILELEDDGEGGTIYTATARHRSPQSAEKHKEMGFYDGWGTVVDQLVEYAKTL